MTNKVFGLAWGAICLGIALFPRLSGGALRWQFAVAAIFLVVAAMLFPAMLAPLNRAWTRFGHTMHAAVSAIALFLIYFLFIVPGGLFLRLCGRKRLVLTFDDAATTYWSQRVSGADTVTDFTKPY